jgi:hypothetical protein
MATAFCWLGAVVDALAVVVLLSPPVAREVLGIRDVVETPALDFAMRTAAALMLGWTVLLVWAARHPPVQRAVIGFTLVPVVVGLIASELLAVRAGFVQLANVGPLLGMQTALLALGGWCLHRDRVV